MSGAIWAKERRRVYFLQRWPSARSMKRVRQRVKELTGRDRCGVRDVRVLIRDLNPLLRGWGNYFRTGNAATKFNQVDTYVWQRLHGFLVKRKGRNLHAGAADGWTRDFFHGHGLHRLRGTVRYPEPHNAVPREIADEPCAGNPHARFLRGSHSTAGEVPQRRK